jgi:hypothetical protein
MLGFARHPVFTTISIPNYMRDTRVSDEFSDGGASHSTKLWFDDENMLGLDIPPDRY